MTITIGSDHAGARTKLRLAQYLMEAGHTVTVQGAQNPDDPYDYPLAADLVATEIKCGRAELGILICGSGIGVSIRANRYSFIRAALCTTPEHAELARLHNHANVLCLGERTTPEDQVTNIVDAFLRTEPDRNERHVRRVDELQAPTEIPPC